jgi:hypothetical protein
MDLYAICFAHFDGEIEVVSHIQAESGEQALWLARRLYFGFGMPIFVRLLDD